jgi:heme/copper-type cytochrome/quinol oxidase subunit 1
VHIILIVSSIIAVIVPGSALKPLISATYGRISAVSVVLISAIVTAKSQQMNDISIGASFQCINRSFEMEIIRTPSGFHAVSIETVYVTGTIESAKSWSE